MSYFETRLTEIYANQKHYPSSAQEKKKLLRPVMSTGTGKCAVCGYPKNRMIHCPWITPVAHVFVALT